MSNPHEHQADAVAAAFQRLIPGLVLFNDRVARQVGLSLTDAQVLHALWQEGGRLTHTQIGRITGQAGATLTRSLDRLVESGFVDRLPDPADRRRSVIQVRPAAMEAFSPHYEGLAAGMRTLAHEFDDEELAVVERYLTRGRELGLDRGGHIHEG